MANATITPLGVMVLALLQEGDMHPYEMVRLLRTRRDTRLVKVTNGTLYHSVNRMLERGLIDRVGTEREGNRPERTTYALTREGADVLVAWVRTELARIDRPGPFRVALAEAHNLPRAEVVELISARRGALVDEIAALEAGLGAPRMRVVSPQYLIELERHLALMRTDLTWTDRFLGSLADPGYAWGSEELSDDERAAYAAQRRTHAQ